MAYTDNRRDAWMRRSHPADGSPRLVCFPHAGGSASYFFPLSAALTPDVDVVVVQYPGRQDRRREPPIDSVPALADAIVAECRPWLVPGTALYGHSMGATLAFEVARRLEDEPGGGPSVLVVSGQRAPSVAQEGSVHLQDDDGIVAEMRRLGGTDTSLLDDPEMRDLVLPAVRSDYKAIESYRYEPGPKLRCPVVAMTGDDDPIVPPGVADPWEDHTQGTFALHRFTGGHFFIAEHAGEVTRIIADAVVGHAGR